MEDIKDWLKNNETQMILAKRLGCDQSSISHFLKSHNIKHPAHKPKACNNNISESKSLPEGKVGVCEYVDRKGTSKIRRFIEVYSTDFDIKDEIIHILKSQGVNIVRIRLQKDYRLIKPRWTIKIKNAILQDVKDILHQYYRRMQK